MKKGIKYYIILLVILLIFGYIVAKDVSLPRVVTFPIILAGLGIILFSAFSSSKLPLYILIAYLPFNNIMIGQFGSDVTGLNLTNILTLLVALGWMSYALSHNEKVLSKSSLNIPVLLFCLWGFFSLFRASFVYGGHYDLWSFFIQFKRWITPILLYYIALSIVRDKETFKKCLFIILAATVIIGLMAIRDYINESDERIGGVFLQPNMLGAYFTYTMFFFLAFFLYYFRTFRYWLMLIPFLICFRGIMVSFSRGAYVACAVGGVMTSFFRNKILFILCLAALVYAVANPEYLPAGIRYRMSSAFGGDKVISTDMEDITDPSVGKRIYIWRGAIEMIKDQPMFGYGYGTFPYVIGYYIPGISGADAHNTYLTIAAEMGVPALVIFIIILLMLIKNAWWILRHTEDRYYKAFALGMIGGVFGLIVANIFGSRLNSEDVSSYFWVLSGLLMRVVLFKKDKVIT